MMNSAREKTNQRIGRLRSLLCVGLDTDIQKIPSIFLSFENPVLEFNKAIIRATEDTAVAYKINTAFYEARGCDGIADMEATLQCLPIDSLRIADAKRADIGNTSSMYAKAFFEHWGFDAITVAPYMGSDSLAPFFAYSDKLVFVLCLTSNEGSADFEERQLADGSRLYEAVLHNVAAWSRNYNGGIVVGATKSGMLAAIRQSAPGLFMLIPGVGAQGGELEAAVRAGVDAEGRSALINVSRALIYPDAPGGASWSSVDAYEAAVTKIASEICNSMRSVL